MDSVSDIDTASRVCTYWNVLVRTQLTPLCGLTTIQKILEFWENRCTSLWTCDEQRLKKKKGRAPVNWRLVFLETQALTQRWSRVHAQPVNLKV